MKNRKQHNLLQYIVTALFAALICVTTMLVQIPIPVTGGYANLGDGVLLTCAFLLHPAQAALAAGLGSMLADVLTGYMVFAPGTLVIKTGMALIAALIFRRLGGKLKQPARMLVRVLAALLAEMWMVLGYFLYESLVLGVGTAAAGGILGNVGQGVVGVLVSCAAAPLLERNRGIRELQDLRKH